MSPWVFVWFGAFVIGSIFFVSAAVLWYFMAKWENQQAFHAICPETMEKVDVYVDAGHAAKTRFHGREELIVLSCSRWPERQGCPQGCTPQVPLLGDSRLDRRYAVFGTQPEWLKCNTPVEMTKEVLAKIPAKAAHA
jgi:hypothetical protein